MDAGKKSGKKEGGRRQGAGKKRGRLGEQVGGIVRGWEKELIHELVLELLYLASLCSQLHEQVQPERHHRMEDPHEGVLCKIILPQQLVKKKEERK